MQSKAKTVSAYLQELPEDRRRIVETIRKTILKALPKGFSEGMQYGMIGYSVPLSVYPAGYLGNPKVPLCYAGLASQKNYISIYLMNVYGDAKTEAWFREEFEKGGYKLDMGKSCVRIKRLDQLNVNAIAKAIAKTSVKKYIAYYEQSRKKK